MNSIKLVQYLRQLVQRAEVQMSDSQRNVFIIANIARGIAQTLPISPSPVDVLHTYFANNYDAQINSVINAFNEQYPIDTRECRDMVFKFYKLRYEMVHSPFMFSHVLMPMCAALPEYFPKDVCDLFMIAVNMSESDRVVYFNDWNTAVGAVMEHVRDNADTPNVV